MFRTTVLNASSIAASDGWEPDNDDESDILLSVNAIREIEIL